MNNPYREGDIFLLVALYFDLWMTRCAPCSILFLYYLLLFVGFQCAARKRWVHAVNRGYMVAVVSPQQRLQFGPLVPNKTGLTHT